MNPLMFPSYMLDSTTTVLQEGWLLLALGLLKEIVSTRMTFCKSTKAMVHSSDSDTDFSDIIPGILLRDTVVEGDPKALFSIATTPRCRGGLHSIPRIAPLYPWPSPYSVESWVLSKVPFFESLVWLDLGLNSGLSGHWRTLYSIGPVLRNIFAPYLFITCLDRVLRMSIE